jgi:hypothetical protein
MTRFIDRVIATHHLAVKIDRDQIGGSDFIEEQPVGVDEVAVVPGRVPG